MLAFDLQRVREKTVSADIVGYEVEDLQGTIGEVDSTTEELVPSFISVDTSSSLNGGRMTLPAVVVERCDHDPRKVYVDRRHNEITNAPESTSDETGKDDDYLRELRRYYGPGGDGYRAPRDAWTKTFSRAFGGDRIDAAAQRQRDMPISERVRLPETGVRDLLLAAGIYVVGFVVLVLLIDVVSSKPTGVDVVDVVAVSVLAFKPLQVVPVLVAAQAFTSAYGGLMHSEFENVDFSWRPLNKATKSVLLIAIPGVVGASAAAVLTYSTFELPDTVIETYIAILVVVMAALVATNALRGDSRKYRPHLLPYFGAVAGANKGLGSGGFGPVVTFGGVISGVLEKTSVAITTMSEGFASTAGTITFVVISALGTAVDWRLLPWLWLGAFPASVVGPYAG